jgi:hypothetical protein
MKVFSKERFIAAEGMDVYKTACRYSDWVNKCDGVRVEGLPRNGTCMVNENEMYSIKDGWCIEVPDDVSMYPRYKIVIEGYENTTLATMYVDGKVIKRTAAKRNPADKFNWKIGAQTAFNRLWEKKKKPMPVFRIDDACVEYLKTLSKNNLAKYKLYARGEW